MAGRLKALVVAGVVAIGGVMVASPARAQQFRPNGNPGPFPPRACGHVGPCHCPRPWSSGHGWGYGGYGHGWGYGHGYGYGWGYGHGGYHGGHGGYHGGHGGYRGGHGGYRGGHR